MAKEDKGPSLILGIGKMAKGKPPANAEGSPEEESLESQDEEATEDDAFGMHADAMFDAIKSDDKEAFKDALKKCLVSGDMGEYSGEE